MRRGSVKDARNADSLVPRFLGETDAQGGDATKLELASGAGAHLHVHGVGRHPGRVAERRFMYTWRDSSQGSGGAERTSVAAPL